MQNTSESIDIAARSGMDELCNFEAPSMCMSIEAHREPCPNTSESSAHHADFHLQVGHADAELEDVIAEYQTSHTSKEFGCSPRNPESMPSSTECSDAMVDEDMLEKFEPDEVAVLDGNSFQSIQLGDLVLWINAGGAALSSTSFGVDLLEDCHFTGGDVLRTGEQIIHTKNPSIYQTARYGDFSYKIQNLLAGIYYVDLHFSEIIFTNGPPGMRIFDVYVQEQKILSKLDIYSKVGSNTPLILMNVKATVECEKGLSVSFRGIVGSPTISGICVRKSHVQGLKQLSINSGQDLELKDDSHFDDPVKPLTTSEMQQNVVDKVELDKPFDERRRKKKNSIRDNEEKIRELKNEVHQAWLSVQDANRQIEKLQSELDCKSFHVDSLAQAVEGQLNELKDVKDTAEIERQKWVVTIVRIASQIKLLKQDYTVLSKEAHEWMSSFPAIQMMTGKIQAVVNEHEELKQKFVKQGQDLRLYHNQVLELKGNIRVFCRCRPLSTTEVNSGACSVVEFDIARDNELAIRVNGAKKVFKFDRIFTPSNNQMDVFMDTAPVVVSVLDGYNVCIFAYGQTGTGKTFTMEGTVQDRGVNYRTLEELFQLASKRAGQFNYDISVSVLEVYNEQIRDLLATPLPLGQTPKKLEIKQLTEGAHHIPGLTVARVQCMEEVWEVLQTGSSARTVGSTNSNEHSSRSHCMLCVMVKGENLLTRECTRSKLWLVDLAGSERVAKTDVQGERLKEAQNINKSLSALGDVIYALTTKNSHIPYRNSKLTHILQDSLGGESKTLMFVQVSPVEQDIAETLCSLNFASRVRGVELGPARKQLDTAELVKYKQLVEKSKQDGRVKDDSLRKLAETCRALSEKVKDSDVQKSLVELKVKEQQLLIEKLRKELKSKESSHPPQGAAGQQLHVVSEVADMGMENDGKTIDGSSQQSRLEEQAKMIAPFKCNSFSSPPASRILPRKPGRASICGVPRRRPSMAMAMVNILPPARVPSSKTNGIESNRSSIDSAGNDSYGDENVPALQPSAAPVTPSGWRKGSSITANTVVRRSIPRKVHFKSPHLQPSYMKAAATVPYQHAHMDGDGTKLPAADKVASVAQQQQKKDQNAQHRAERKGANKMRRVSIATIVGKPPFSAQQFYQMLPSSNNTTMPGIAPMPLQPLLGVPQRVLVANNSTSSGKAAASLYNRERGWNR